MKDTRLQEDNKVVDLAKVQYGADFAKVFSYRKAGQPETCRLVRPYAIARRYRTLNGLTPEVPIGQDQETEDPL
jgi:hypothetical protein